MLISHGMTKRNWVAVFVTERHYYNGTRTNRENRCVCLSCYLSDERGSVCGYLKVLYRGPQDCYTLQEWLVLRELVRYGPLFCHWLSTVRYNSVAFD